MGFCSNIPSRRLLAEEGLSFRFDHDQSAEAGDKATHARHQLVVFDRSTERPHCTQAEIRFHRSHATEASDTIDVWHEARKVLPNAVTLNGWDYKSLVATGAEAKSALNNGELPSLEIYEASLPYRFEDGTAAQLRTDLAMAAFEAGYRQFAGKGSVRQLAEGRVFTLTQHDDYVGDLIKIRCNAQL
ncbi:contractile injection system protein, VgrG/Pvc8 family [Quatrionicoccus australiensis]|uniref:contractile injection system protein, VgrG/Pvc8 family n=1 Tax=Quatrionicoccus australiensis TaxID=138118 RepID=UPI001CFC3CA3|nr:contractile injection system protein, VgrG/Pvc8 family [Quatrionicoccus australiensis]